MELELVDEIRFVRNLFDYWKNAAGVLLGRQPICPRQINATDPSRETTLIPIRGLGSESADIETAGGSRSLPERIED